MDKNKCFAYEPVGGRRCRILKDNKSCGDSCAFRKTEDEVQRSQQLAYARLRLLPKYEQAAIADRYYYGKRQWMEVAK